jgi:hypothetical protein
MNFAIPLYTLIILELNARGRRVPKTHQLFQTDLQNSKNPGEIVTYLLHLYCG